MCVCAGGGTIILVASAPGDKKRKINMDRGFISCFAAAAVWRRLCIGFNLGSTIELQPRSTSISCSGYMLHMDGAFFSVVGAQHIID